MSKKKPKQAGICSRARHGRTYYFAEIGGKQVGLGCDLDSAKAKYTQKIAEHVERAKLASQVQAAEAKPAEMNPAEFKPVLTVRALLFAFLEWCEKKRAPGTFKFYLRAIAGDATESHGYVSFDEYLTKHGKAELPATDLDQSDVQSWIDDHFSETSSTYQHNLIRSVQRAYGQSASQAETLSAKLFKTIELGRVTADELATAFGRVAAVGAEIGASQDELLAAFSSITIGGVSASEAATQIRGLLTGFLKPTEALTAALHKLGFETGEQAIQALGMVGALTAVIGTTDGSTTSVAKLFTNVRALNAVLRTSGNGFAIYEDHLKQIESASRTAKPGRSGDQRPV